MATPAATLQILVTANARQAQAELMKTDAALRKTAATAKTTTAATAATVGRGMARAATAIGVAGGASIAAAAKFEQAFAEVRKTVDTTEAGFDRIEKGLRNMAKEIPVSVTELSNLAGEAGALGVKAKDIVGFTRVAADLGVTTNLAASDAANALARLANIMDTEGRKAFERMGSTLVDLGNKGASTEAEITEMALRIAGAGETIGLTESQVLGFASALANVGIRAEAGGSSISRVMLEMQDAVAQGGSALNNFASIAGMSGGKFEQLFKTDAPAAIQAFVQGLDKVKDSGGSVIETLDQVNLNEIRVRDTLLRLGGATGEVSDAQRIANAAWGKNNALAVEANKRYKTTISQFEILKNRVFDLGITFGQDLLPEVNKAMRALGEGNLDKAIAVMAELGGKMAVRFAGAFGKAFLESDILGRLFLGGLLIRVLGGRGAFLALGKFIGTRVGAGLAIGLILAGPDIVKEAYKIGLRIGNALENAIGSLSDIISGKRDAADVFSPREALRIGGLKAVIDLYEQMGMTAKQAAKEAGELLERVQDKRLERGAERASENITRANEQAGDSYEKHGKRAKEAAGTVDKATGNIKQSVNDDMGAASKSAIDKGAKMGKGISQPAFHAAKAVAAGMKNIAENVSESLSALAVKKSINFHIREPHEQRGPGMQTYQTGGVIVPGQGSGDKVPALLEPGEVVVNKKAAAAMGGAQKVNRLNRMIPRFAKGGVAGGLNFALGPYDIPPIQYAADHAGPNSHWHITGTTTPWVVGIGKKLQQMGFMVGEHPAFGGVAPPPAHSATGGHYDALAIDVNSAADETRAETARVAAILKGAGVSGAVAEKIARVILTGRGPLRDIGQAALDKVRGAANKFLSRQAPSGVAPKGAVAGIGGAVSRGEMRKLLKAHGMPNWTGWIAMAESMLNPRAVSSAGARGLFQIMPFWGGGDKLFDPNYNVAKARHILDTQGLSAWNPSKYAGAIPEGWGPHQGQKFQKGGIAGPNTAHSLLKWFRHHKRHQGRRVDEWNALPDKRRAEFAQRLRFLMDPRMWSVMEDGSISRLLSGGIVGLAGGTKGNKGVDAVAGPGGAGGHGKGFADIPNRMKNRIKDINKKIRDIRTTIGTKELRFAFPGSEAGADLGPGELAQLANLGGTGEYNRLLSTYQMLESVLVKGLGMVHRKSPAHKWLKQRLAPLRPGPDSPGLLLETQATIADLLGQGATTTVDTGPQVDLLSEMLRQANLRYAVSQAQYGVFAGGGVAPPMVTPTVTPTVGNADVAIYDYGGGNREVSVNGQMIDPRKVVQAGSRHAGRRPLPSSRGY